MCSTVASVEKSHVWAFSEIQEPVRDKGPIVPDVDEATLDPELSSEELCPELLLRLLLALSGTDTLAEVDLVTDDVSTFS